MGIFQHLRRDENLTAEAAWKEGTFITGDCSICSSVLPLSSSAAQDLHALECWVQGGGLLPPPSKLAKSVYFCDFYGARFCCKMCLRFLENANKKLEILLLV